MRSRANAGVWLLLLPLSACKSGSGEQSVAVPTPNDAFGGVQCSAVRPQTEPDLMAWDSGSRLNLKRLRSEGVVAVRYEAEGCNVKLELLANCIGKGTYKYTPYSANERKVAHDTKELFAQLPLGAARLTGNMKGERALRTDYMLVGQYALPAGSSYTRADLKGPDCDRATHVVSATYTGGFAMVAGASRSIDAAATVFGAGAGGASSASVESLANEGNAEACAEAQKTGEPKITCDAPLRLSLLPLEGTKPQPAVTTAQPTAAAQTTATTAPSAAGSCPAGMAFVQGGTFTHEPENKAKKKEVTVASFCIDKTHVTADAYAACVKTNTCTDENLRTCRDPWGTTTAYPERVTYGAPGKGSHPINCVDWYEATRYCRAQGKRLLTEWEWEFIAHGGNKHTRYPWGDDKPSSNICWSGLVERTGTCPVGSFPAGDAPGGIHDLLGNVHEWTSSKDESDASKRMLRGANFRSSWVTTVDGLENSPANKSVEWGFRCAK